MGVSFVVVNTRLTRQESRARTRAAVVEAAGRVFAARGFEGASMEEIAAEAGFTRGAVYSNFDDKADLFIAVLEERERQRAAQVGEIFRDSGDAAGFFAALAESNRSDDRDVERWTMLGMEFDLFALRHPEVRPRLAAYRRRLLDDVARAVQAVLDSAGIEPPRPVEDIAVVVQALDEGLTVMRMVDPDRVPRDLFLNALGLLLEAAGQVSGSSPGSGRRRRRPS